MQTQQAQQATKLAIESAVQAVPTLSVVVYRLCLTAWSDMFPYLLQAMPNPRNIPRYVPAPDMQHIHNILTNIRHRFGHQWSLDGQQIFRQLVCMELCSVFTWSFRKQMKTLHLVKKWRKLQIQTNTGRFPNINRNKSLKRYKRGLGIPICIKIQGMLINMAYSNSIIY